MVWAGAFYSPGSYGSASICHLVEKHFRRRRSVCCRLGRSWGRWGDHCKKRLFGLPGAWHSAVPSWALGDPASWPSVSLSSCTSCPGSPPPPILSSVRGVVSPRTDYCQDWHVKTSSLVSSTCIGIVAVTRVAPGGPEGDCNLPRATQEVAEPGGTSCCLFLLSFSPNI